MLKKTRKIPQLEELARTMIGDNKSPDVFFVSIDGVIVLVTTSFEVAYEEWKKVSYSHQRIPSMLENRQFGVIADVDEEYDENDKPTGRWRVRDDRQLYLHLKKKRTPHQNNAPESIQTVSDDK